MLRLEDPYLLGAPESFGQDVHQCRIQVVDCAPEGIEFGGILCHAGPLGNYAFAARCPLGAQHELRLGLPAHRGIIEDHFLDVRA